MGHMFSQSKYMPFFMTDLRIVKELMATLHSLHRNMRKLDTSDDCSPMSMLQMHTLLQVQEHGSCSMKELAKAQKIVPATMTALVERLVKKDMLRREEDPEDRRVIRVRLTEGGKAALRAFYEEKQRRAVMFLDILSEEEQKTFVNLMKKIDQHFLTLLAKEE